MKPTSCGRAGLLLVFIVACWPALASALVTVTQPLDGETRTAEVCEVSPCTARFPLVVDITGADLGNLEIRFSSTDAGAFTYLICEPDDQIEQIDFSCPASPFIHVHPHGGVSLGEGVWQATVRYTLESGGPLISLPAIQLTVLPPGGAFVGPISLSAVNPIFGQTNITARDAADGVDAVVIPPVSGAPTEVEIIGENLHNNPFLDVFMAPIRHGEPSLTEESALPVQDWCLHEAEILGSEEMADGRSKLRVRVPDMPALIESNCRPGAISSRGHPYLADWRWVIRDRWIDETLHDRVHTYWTIPSPRDGVSWGDAPSFTIEPPPFPDIHGFGFENTATDATFNEFLTVFEENAYICVGKYGICATHIPDPLYFILWYPLYSAVLNSSGGSCNGMAATSQFLWPDASPEPEDFDPNVHFAAGFTEPGDAKYEPTNICTPLCSPPRPDSLWATIRMNHGVQISREFLLELIKTAGKAIFDLESSTADIGIPNVTLDKIKDRPQDYVLCFFNAGNGHCVTPYEVEDNRIWIYDNNNPGDESLYIDIVDGEYDYPARIDTPNHGKAIVAFPLTLWEEGRNLLSWDELTSIIDGVDFLYSLVAGSADMVVTNDDGARWGWEDDGTFTDDFPKALSMPPLGPQSIPVHQVPLLVPMDAPAPMVKISADGGQYFFHSVQHGHLLQLEVDGVAGDKDRVQMGYSAGKLSSFRFTPESDTSKVVPRIGLEISEEDSALFHWQGLTLPAGTSAGFGADKAAKSVTYSNDTGMPSNHVLMLDNAAGDPERYGRMIYGPFEVPDGADQKVVLNNWPDVNEVVSELDFDRDGNVDHRQVITGRPVMPPTDLDSVADISVNKTVDKQTASVGEELTYVVEITNHGPEMANGVTLIDSLPDYAQPWNISVTQGTCVATAAGMDCDFGGILAGETIIIQYLVTVELPGTLTNSITVFSNERDPDLTNNSALVTTDVPVLLDIKPDDANNVVNPKSNEVVPVAILGLPEFDLAQIDVSTLKFGTGKAMPAHKAGGHVSDLNGDGVLDLLSHYPVVDSGIVKGDTEACVSGRFLDGRAFNGCDTLNTVP